MSFRIKFWGVRGSIACPSMSYVVYGGNTSCVEVEVDGATIILDAGTGLRGLGKKVLAKNIRRSSMLLTHTHWDHISGFPFFAPVFMPDREFSVYSGHLNGMSVRDVLAEQMRGPMFPVPLEALQAKLDFIDFQVGDGFELEGVKVRTAPLNHPNGATGYRLDFRGKSLCYTTDTEHRPGRPDENILGLIDGADLVIYDSSYTEAEFPARVGWGHSTWNEGVRLARRANVKKLVIFHHDPDHEDPFMEKLEAEAKETWEHTIVARDNMELTLVE